MRKNVLLVLCFVLFLLQGCTGLHVSGNPFLARAVVKVADALPSLPCPNGENIKNTQGIGILPRRYVGPVFYSEAYASTTDCIDHRYLYEQ